ncbi:MAG: hypothetical protein ACOCZ8_06910 [Bacteroidota bacterium]
MFPIRTLFFAFALSLVAVALNGQQPFGYEQQQRPLDGDPERKSNRAKPFWNNDDVLKGDSLGYDVDSVEWDLPSLFDHKEYEGELEYETELDKSKKAAAFERTRQERREQKSIARFSETSKWTLAFTSGFGFAYHYTQRPGSGWSQQDYLPQHFISFLNPRVDLGRSILLNPKRKLDFELSVGFEHLPNAHPNVPLQVGLGLLTTTNAGRVQWQYGFRTSWIVHRFRQYDSNGNREVVPLEEHSLMLSAVGRMILPLGQSSSAFVMGLESNHANVFGVIYDTTRTMGRFWQSRLMLHVGFRFGFGKLGEKE